MKKIILIDKNYIFIKFLISFFSNKNTYIYYFHPYQVDVYKSFIRKIKNKKIFSINHKTEQNITYKANKLALDILEKKNYNYIIKFFDQVDISKSIIVAYKKYLLQVIAYEIRQALILNFLSTETTYKSKIIVFSNLKNRKFFKKFFINSNKVLFLPNFYFDSIFSIFLLFLYLPIFGIIKIFRNGFNFKKFQPKYFDYGFHFYNNIYKRNIFASDKSYMTSRSDFHLAEMLGYTGKKTIYINSNWSFDKSDIERNINEINKRNNYFGSEFSAPINTTILTKLLKYYFKSLVYFLPTIITHKISYKEFKPIIQILRDLILSEIFCSSYRIKNFISRDDYNPIHISRTIVFNKYGLKNNGISHSICLNTNASMQGPYVFFDTYFTQGKFYLDIWKKYWFSNLHKNLGPLYGHLVTEALQDKKNHELFEKKYGNGKKICFLMNSFDSNTCPFDSEETIQYTERKKLLKLMKLDNDIILFIVPRNKKSLNKFLKSFDNYDLYKNRIVIDYLFSTYELMAYCDFLITDISSSSIFEGTFNPNLSIIPMNMRKTSLNILDDYSDIFTYSTYEEIYQDLSKTYKLTNYLPINNREIKKNLF